ncbi:RelA/SpoT family protein [Oceanivirga salmonicida]|uniref:RelA/SpoT family protein n=1 Tax=Oceanivirga salmonicida TaxID=1769291 RepID=UPI00082BB498|nr:bifunctional (p)ppGpp synthetase/guanosine-3',5'-bis(diphosphate) 3'-pyrophosphohydrolase [Oceanivirga salmonicida]
MSYKESYTRLFDKIKANKNLDIEKINKAFVLAREAHQDQYRKSGEEYIIHPIEVSEILTDLNMDTDTIVAGLLHDVVEDSLITLADIQYEFGEDVAILVDGVTKLRNLPKKHGKQIENVRKMVVAMSKDIRVVIIKLADRLHNMRTIKFQSPNKQVEKAKECLDIFAPIAHRIGMSKIKSELEDISFNCVNPDGYNEIKKLVNRKKEQRDKQTNLIIEEIKKDLEKYNIKAVVTGRAKHLYSIYRKMVEKNKKFTDLMDLIAIRVIVDKEEDCYMVLGAVHSIFIPVSGRFKDYIAVPKSNGYQSIHTTIEYSENQNVEIQIRTKAMHAIAEDGVAAHWKYKEKKTKDKNEDYYKAIKKIIGSNTAQELTEEVLYKTIFVFTPKGDVLELDSNSTALDFAFQVHTQIGYRTIGARVNDRIVPLDHVLENGDKVEILTSKATKGPGRDWQNMVNSNSSKAKIRKWFKDREFVDKVKEGQELLEEEFLKLGLRFKDLEDDDKVHLYMKKYNIKDIDHLYYRFAIYDLHLETFIQKFRPEEPENEEKLLEEATEKGNKIADKFSENDNTGIKISGSDNTLFHFAKCCNPLPGIKIKGYVTRGRGIVIHKFDCENIKNLMFKEPEREVEVYWDEKLLENSTAKYPYSFKIIALNRDGLLLEYIKIINEQKLDIVLMNTNLKNKNGQVHAIISMRIMIRSKENFEKLKKNLLNVKDTLEII